MDVTTFSCCFPSPPCLIIHSSQIRFYLILLMLCSLRRVDRQCAEPLEGKVNGKRLLRAVWRLGFVSMSFGYIVFTFWSPLLHN